MRVLGDAFRALSDLAVTFVDAAKRSVSSNRQTEQSGTDTTKVGVTQFGSVSNDAGGPFAGTVAADYGTCSGGAGNYVQATGTCGTIPGGERCDVRGTHGTAYGYRCFANGIGSVAGGYINVVGRDQASHGNQKNYGAAFGRQNFCWGESGFCAGGQNLVHWDSTAGTTLGTDNDVGDGTHVADNAGALGFQCAAMANQSWAIGEGCQTFGQGSIALGGACVTTGPYSLGAGFNCETSSSAHGGAALGRYSKATRYGQAALAWNRFSATGDAQKSFFGVQGTSTNGSAVALADPLGASLTLENGRAYNIRATILANRTDAAGRARWVKDLLVHCSGGTAVLDDNTATLTTANGEAWTAVFSVSGTTLIITFTGTAGHTVRVTCTYEIDEIAGGA